jgi:hypothetical protein
LDESKNKPIIKSWDLTKCGKSSKKVKRLAKSVDLHDEGDPAMAIAFEKPLKDFLKNFQKDLTQLQKTLKKESDDLLKKVKSTTQKDHIQAKRKEIEKLIEKNLKKYEPTINKFVAEVHSSAKKAGIDLSEIEKKVRDNLHFAKDKLAKTTIGKKATKVAKKTSTGPKRPAAKKAKTAKSASDESSK